MTMTKADMIKFMSMIDKDDNGCWTWLGGGKAYGRFYFTRTDRWLAHRLMWTIHHGDIPKKKLIRHLCHNPRCVNIKHLAIGTDQDNMNDMVKANRQARGEGHPAARLTTKIVRELRAKYKTGRYNYDEIANLYKISSIHAWQIVQRVNWKHV